MAIMWRGRFIEPEEIVILPQKEQREIIDALQNEMNGKAGKPDFTEQGYIYADELDMEEDYIPEIEAHGIRNPEGMRMYEAMLASGKSHREALEKVTELFDLEDEGDDKTYKGLKEELDSRTDYPYGLRNKIISFALSRGINIDSAISEIGVHANRYSIHKQTTGDRLSENIQKDRQNKYEPSRDKAEEAYQRQQKTYGLGEYSNRRMED